MIVPDSERCEEQVHDGGRMVSFHRCHNRAKGEHEGKRLCGQHLAAIERRKKKDEAYQDRREREEIHRRYLDELGERHGIEIEPDYSWAASRYKFDEVVISLDDLLKLLGEEKP